MWINLETFNTTLLSKVLVPLRNQYHLILVLILNKTFINLEAETDVHEMDVHEAL